VADQSGDPISKHLAEAYADAVLVYQDWNPHDGTRCGGSRKKIGTVEVKTVLFLCTGNYYRSRFAEELFNHHAERAGHDWIAQSRGLALERGVHNVGPISPFALCALREMAVITRCADRFPQQCTTDDLADADLVVAVKEAEHRPLMRERFAEWEHRLSYWNIHDIEDAAPGDALNLLAQEVRTLLLLLREKARAGAS
jgi:protein-tyrosine phosphatase